MQLIIPAYNEAARLPATLAALRAHVEATGDHLGPIEVLVVDNGSTDDTAALARAASSSVLPVRVLRCAARGKGAAVRAGVLASDADVVGYMDADGATDLAALAVGRALVAEGVDVAVGSRAVVGSVTMVRHSRVRQAGATYYRRQTGRVAPGIRDTQCGFKVMRGDVARRVVADLRSTGFSFDVELIGRALRLGARVAEFPVVWHDVPGSTFSPARHGLSAFWELAVIAWSLRGQAVPLSPPLTTAPLELTAPVAPAAATSVTLPRPTRAPPPPVDRGARPGRGRRRGRPLNALPLRGRRAAVVNWRDLDHSLAGGSERYAWECALALRDLGADVTFLTAREPGQSRRETRDGLHVRRQGRQYSFYPATLAALALARLRRRGFDVVVDPENGIPVFSPLVVSRRSVVVLVMHHVHQEQFRTYFPRPVSDFGRFLERRLMPWVYRRSPTVVVSRSTQDEMARQLRWRPAAVLVHNGTSASSEPAPDPAPDRGRPASSAPPRLLVLGRLAEHKRIDVVVAMVPALRAEFPGLTLDVVGRGPVADRLAELVAELGLEDVVKLHGYLDERRKTEVLEDATLHVCASDAEGWGQVVVEAAAHGVPTLARDVPGLRDSIRPGRTGWLVGGADVESSTEDLLAGARRALALLADPAVRATVADDCRTWAAGFTWADHHARFGEVVVAALQERASGRSTTR